MKNKINLTLPTKADRKNKYYISSIITVGILFTLIGLELFKNGSIFDEIVGLLSIILLFLLSKRITRQDLITIFVLASVVLIGVISNIVSGIVTDVKSIGIDIIVETKLITGFLALKYLTNEKEKTAIINALIPLAKLFVLVTFACSILSQFVNLGMTGEIRYHIRSFQFIFNFNHQYIAVYMLVFGIITCNISMSDKQRSRYKFLALVAIIASTKSPAIIFTGVYIGMYFYFKKHKKIKLWVYVAGIILIILLGQYQINEYLIKNDAPRRLFFEYGVKTANNYFPLGSGFSTFGSGEAQHNYSPLYYTYGFDSKFGMSPDDPAFLNDTFWAMALGQFGWIGGIFYLIVYTRLFFKSIDNVNYSYERRAFLYGAYMQYMIHAIGSAILSSSAGMIGFMSLALFCITKPDEKEQKGRLKIHW